MKKVDLVKILNVVKDDSGLIARFQFAGFDPEKGVITVNGYDDGSECKSAFYAGADLLRHGLFDHPLTQVGLHYRTQTGTENSFMERNVAVICVNFEKEGTDYNGLVPTLEKFPCGWAQVNVMNRIKVLGNLPEPEVAARKHNFIDALLLGHGLDIRVPRYLQIPNPKGETAWAVVMEDQFFTVLDREALQKRNDRINSFLDRQGAYQAVKRATVGKGFDPRKVEQINSSTVVTLVDNTEVPAEELALGQYTVYNKNRIVRTFTWDASDGAKVFLGHALKKNWKLRKL